MVVFEDGMPRKDAYRTFNIRGQDGSGTPDDTSAMNEVLTRRFSRLLAEEAGVEGEDEDGVAFASGPIDETTGRPKRFSYRPDLVLVDGGLPQVNAARAALDAVGADVPVVGLAKRLEVPRRLCISSSICATSPTASRSPSTARGDRRRSGVRCWTPSRG